MIGRWTALWTACLAGAASGAPGGPVSGEPLPVRCDGGTGLLAAPRAITTVPVGCARVFGGRRPDLFVASPTGVDQALLLYRWVRDDAAGTPVFAPPVRVAHPFGSGAPPPGTVFEDESGAVRALWIRDAGLVHGRFDREALAFRETGRVGIGGLPRTPTSVAAIGVSTSGLDVALSCYNGARYRPDGDASRLDYVLYDGSGAFRGLWPRSEVHRCRLRADASALLEPARPLSATNDAILGGVRLAAVRLPGREAPWIVAGANLGNLYAFDAAAPAASPRRMLAGTNGIAIRHPTIGTAPVAYPDGAGLPSGLIVGGEGALYHYAFAGAVHADGRPVFHDPRPVLQERATLYAGSLAVPCVVDWDGDGVHDLVAGNSEGRLLFFGNRGTDRDPAFGRGEPLSAGGEPIHVQPGYHGIQGPFETRWGYTCPRVADWNGDGLPDVLLSGATARHELLLNTGARGAPRLAAPAPLYCDGLELHGTWRVRPGTARIGGRMAYVMQDDANALHLYWRIDDRNVEDGGRLLMEDGTPITSHRPDGAEGPGQRGRAKISIADWDGDGTLDLLLGTIKRASIPDPDHGLPWSLRGRDGKGLQVLFLRNAGTDAAPRYQKPRIFQFRGRDLYLGGHSNAPEVCPFGDTSHGPNLLVGAEDGRIHFFARADLTFDPR